MTPSSTLADEQLPPKPPSAAGLSSAEAEARLDQYGANEPAPAKHSSTVLELLLLFLNPLVIILVIVLLSSAINFIQTYRSQQAINRLRADVAPTATVLRDGTWQ
ncbi:MAG: cation-transporting P-type ATPase, partial [Candidatus Acidiferrales bacterium]